MEGWKFPQEEGRKSCRSEVVTIMKRSNHMPTLQRMARTNTRGRQRRTALNQKSWGTVRLIVRQVMAYHAAVPWKRSQKAPRSKPLPLYQAQKSS